MAGNPSNTGKASQAVEIARRRSIVANLAVAYVPGYQIAQEVGVSPATVSKDLKAIREAWLEEAKADVQVAAAKELRSLDRLESRLWQQFTASGMSADERTRTALAILKAKERRARMLGFDTADLIEVTLTAEMVESEIIRLREELGYDGPRAVGA